MGIVRVARTNGVRGGVFQAISTKRPLCLSETRPMPSVAKTIHRPRERANRRARAANRRFCSFCGEPVHAVRPKKPVGFAKTECRECSAGSGAVRAPRTVQIKPRMNADEPDSSTRETGCGRSMAMIRRQLDVVATQTLGAIGPFFAPTNGRVRRGRLEGPQCKLRRLARRRC